MKKFKDFYGNTASIKELKNGGYQLCIYIQGKLYMKKNYETERGARVALGRLGDGEFSEI